MSPFVSLGEQVVALLAVFFKPLKVERYGANCRDFEEPIGGLSRYVPALQRDLQRKAYCPDWQCQKESDLSCTLKGILLNEGQGLRSKIQSCLPLVGSRWELRVQELTSLFVVSRVKSWLEQSKQK